MQDSSLVMENCGEKQRIIFSVFHSVNKYKFLSTMLFFLYNLNFVLGWIYIYSSF